MSRSVRIRGDIAAQVEAVAVRERRPFANAVEVLLLAALSPSRELAERLAVSGGLVMPGPSAKKKPSVEAAKVPGVSVGVRAHMRADRYGLECSERVLPGNKCAKCGMTV